MSLGQASNSGSRRRGVRTTAVLVLLLAPSALSAAPGAPAAGPEVSYRLRFEHPGQQRLQVEMQLSAQLPVELAMPVWTPGSYRERHFIRNLTPGEARTASGRRLRWVRSGRDRFRVEDATDGAARPGAARPASPQQLSISYSIFAGNFSDDASHIDDEHAHLCGVTVFLMVPPLRNVAHRLQLVAPRGWHVATPLDPVAGRAGQYRAANYDELVDAPLELGRFASAEVQAGQKRLQIAWHEAAGRPMPPKLPSQVRRIVELHRRWLGALPYQRYVLVIHTMPGQDYRGLEHSRGASLVVPDSVQSDPEDYDDLLYVIAHEHLHVWNGKRLRPAEHLPYNYAAPQPTRLLWWTEGVTDYLARRTLLGIGKWRAARYLDALGIEVSRVQSSPQRLWRSLSDLSYEVWWPHRDPGEPALNYYSKGHVVALLLDLEIRALSQGRAGLLQVLQRLLARAASGPVALTRVELERELKAAAGVDLGPQLAAWVDRPGELPYAATLARLGLRLAERRLPARPDAGFSAELQGTELVVDAVAREGPAAKAGLIVGDRVIAIDGSRPHRGWRIQLGETGRHTLRVLRRGAQREIAIAVRNHAPKAWAVKEAPSPPESISLQRAAWLSP